MIKRIRARHFARRVARIQSWIDEIQARQDAYRSRNR